MEGFGIGRLRGRVGMAGATTTGGVVAMLTGVAVGVGREVTGGEEYLEPDGLRTRVSSSMVFIEARAAESKGDELSSDANCSIVVSPLPRPLSPSKSKSATGLLASAVLFMSLSVGTTTLPSEARTGGWVANVGMSTSPEFNPGKKAAGGGDTAAAATMQTNMSVERHCQCTVHTALCSLALRPDSFLLLLRR